MPYLSLSLWKCIWVKMQAQWCSSFEGQFRNTLFVARNAEMQAELLVTVVCDKWLQKVGAEGSLCRILKNLGFMISSQASAPSKSSEDTGWHDKRANRIICATVYHVCLSLLLPHAVSERSINFWIVFFLLARNTAWLAYLLINPTSLYVASGLYFPTNWIACNSGSSHHFLWYDSELRISWIA